MKSTMTREAGFMASEKFIDELHKAKKRGVSYIIINPGAFTHTSIALRDAFLGVSIPFIEVYFKHIWQRRI